MTYDINARRAQRLEATGGEHWPIVLDGQTYNLPREIPWELIEKIDEIQAADSAEGLRAIFAVLLHGQDFPLKRLSVPDMADLMDSYMQEAGITLGESGPSPSSSASTARPSKPTSKRSTGSRSRTSTAARSRGGASKS